MSIERNWKNPRSRRMWSQKRGYQRRQHAKAMRKSYRRWQSFFRVQRLASMKQKIALSVFSVLMMLIAFSIIRILR